LLLLLGKSLFEIHYRNLLNLLIIAVTNIVILTVTLMGLNAITNGLTTFNVICRLEGQTTVSKRALTRTGTPEILLR
jgi:hypothetical protein